MLLTVIGPTAYRRLRNLLSPAKLGETAYKDLVDAMKKHVNPTPSVTVQRFKFNSRSRQPGETVSTYLSELRSIAEFCNFGQSLDDMLRDRLICGINDEQIQRRLLAESKLTLKRALEVAQGLETAAQNAQALQGTSQTAMGLTGPAQPEIHKISSQLQAIACFRCGKSNHIPAKCKFKDAKCHHCGKVGHIKSACRSKKAVDKVDQSVRRRNVHCVQDATETELAKEYTLFKLSANKHSQSYTVILNVDGQDLSMEIDTGASLSIISEETRKLLWPNKRLQPSTVKLATYSGESLAIKGCMLVKVQYDQQEATLSLLVVQGNGPSLLGRDWLQQLQLNWQKIHSLHSCSLQEVLQRHADIFEEGLGTLKGYQAKIHIDTTATPRFFKARSVPYSMQHLVDKELDKLVQEGVIEPVRFADWAAPIVPVLKSDKTSVRICGDFKVTVNRVSKLDRYPIPKIEDLFAKLAGGKKFSQLDMSQAYQQLLLDDQSKNYVVINTHRGLFRYNRLPYGISSAPGIFQRTIETLLQGIPNVVVYLDDILITGPTDQEHLGTLEKVLTRMEQAGLRLKKSKCVFMVDSVTYLGHRIDENGLHPIAKKLKAVQCAPKPSNISELKSYLGLLTYYGKFLPNLASILAPLYKLLRTSVRWHWSSEQDEAFETSKKLLTSSQLLVHFDPHKKLVLSCDASAYGIGAVLAHQFSDGSEKPIGYASRTLSPAERNYSQIEREGLACVFGVQKFHSYIFGHHFTLITDHKPLVSLFSEQRAIPPHASARIQRWALTLAMYEYTIAFRPTKAHGNADAMSRLPLPVLPTAVPQPPEMVLLMEQLDQSPVTAANVRTWTNTDPLMSRVRQFILSGWPSTINDEMLKPYFSKRTELSVQDGCVLWGNRVIIPNIGQPEVLQELHEAHPGATRMKRLARMFVWWPAIDQDIEEKVKSCAECQFQRPTPPLAPLSPWQWPSRPWSRVHIDFLGPFMGHMFLLLIDAHSKWIEVHPMASITATATIQCLRNIFAQLGLPEKIVSDNGPTFVSAEFKNFLQRNGVKHSTTSPYHPSSNGLAERAVQTFKNGLKKMKDGTLQTKISRFLFFYRTTPQSTTGMSPAELLFGRKLRSPLDLLKPDLHQRVEHEQARQKAAHDKHSVNRCFNIGDPVFAHNFARGSQWLPATIVERSGPLSFKVKLLEGGMIWRRHQDHLRQRSVIDSEAKRAVNPSIGNPLLIEYPDLLIPDDSSSIEANDTSLTKGTKVVRPSPRRNPKRTRTQPKRYVA